MVIIPILEEFIFTSLIINFEFTVIAAKTIKNALELISDGILQFKGLKLVTFLILI